MHVDDSALLARLQHDYPHEVELCVLRCWVDVLEADNARLRADAERKGAAGAVFAGTGSVQAANTVYDPLTSPETGREMFIPRRGDFTHNDPPPR